MISLNEVSSGESLREIVAQDLKKELSNFNDEKKGIRILAERMGINKKTLRRLLACENRPGYLTLYKIYRAIHGTTSDTEILKLVHPTVANEIKKLNPKKLRDNINYDVDVEKILLNDPVAAEIYFLAGTDPISREMIVYRFGQYGEDRLNSLLKEKVLQVLESGRITLGVNRANFSSELIKKCGLNLTDRYARPEETEVNGENYIAIYGNTLDEETYNEWLKIDEEAYYKKVELCKRAKNSGTIRAFTFMVTDKL